jgi:hypothetical protein
MKEPQNVEGIFTYLGRTEFLNDLWMEKTNACAFRRYSVISFHKRKRPFSIFFLNNESAQCSR